MSSGSATMSRTRRRGLSDEIGSWKIIWSLVRSRRRAPERHVVSSTPPRFTEPRVGLITWATARPVVDLPHPDSPTSPRVSPSNRSKETPETAWTVWPACG